MPGTDAAAPLSLVSTQMAVLGRSLVESIRISQAQSMNSEFIAEHLRLRKSRFLKPMVRTQPHTIPAPFYL